MPTEAINSSRVSGRGYLSKDTRNLGGMEIFERKRETLKDALCKRLVTRTEEAVRKAEPEMGSLAAEVGT